MHWWVFFAVNPLQQMTRTQVREAKSFCGECPVRLECLDYSYDHSEGFGIWGGLTPEERRRALEHYDGDVDQVIRAVAAGTLALGIVLR